MTNFRDGEHISEVVVHIDPYNNRLVNNATIDNNLTDNTRTGVNSNSPLPPKTVPKKKSQNICERTTRTEKLIAIFMIVVAIVFILLYIFGDSVSSYEPPLNAAKKYEKFNENNNICYTPECVSLAANILEDLDLTEDPCNNFYTFSCGNYIDKHLIPEDEVSADVFSDVEKTLEKQIKKIISTEPDENYIRPMRMANSLYKLCMNTTAQEMYALKEFKETMSIFGEWPVVSQERWNEDEWSWESMTFKSRKIGFNYDFLFDFSVSYDLKNSSLRLLELDQPVFGVEREYLLKGLENDIVQAYYDFMVDVAVTFGANYDRARKDLKDSLDFEIELAKIAWSTEQRKNFPALNNPTKIADLQVKYQYVNWLSYINMLLTIEVDLGEKVNVVIPDYFKKLELLLKKTPKRVIANYWFWRVHKFSVTYINEKLRDRQLQYATKVNGKQQREPRWRECVDEVKSDFPVAVGSLYVRKHFKKDAKAAALELVSEIKKVFKNILVKLDWMDDVSKKAALVKLDKIVAHIGYPDEIMDDGKIIEYYKNLKIDDNSYFKSILSTNKFYMDRSFNKLRKPVNKTDWEHHASAAVVNAYYNSLENSIRFPAGILQGRFFSHKHPNYMNFGAIGFVIGHEITHGFDDTGRQFDWNGNLRDWWANETKTAYLQKAAGIIQQYSNFIDKASGLKINGVLTQGENIADNGGAKESYIAYSNWVKENGAEPKLPGLQNYTSTQLFWISTAQIWCSKERPEFRKRLITIDKHPPSEFRIIGSLSNMKEFSEDFQCALGSTMNPVNKYNVW